VSRSEPLLERLREWDEEALAQAYDAHAPAIYRYAYRLTGHRATAQDIVSGTFHRLLVAIRNGGGPTQHLSAWLYRVAHNLAVDEYRRQPQQEPVPLDRAPDIPVSGGQEEHVLDLETAGRVRDALHALTPLQRQVIVLRFLEGLTVEQTGRVVERTVGAVKAVQHRALRSLRRLMEAQK
jgi:RNA polymerase sigma-70 factor (ECF subfamily)